MADVLRSFARRLPSPVRSRAKGVRTHIQAVATDRSRARRRPKAVGFERAVTEPDQCLVCGSGDVRGAGVTYFRNPELSCDTRRCRECGFVSIPRGESKYRAMTAIHELPSPGDRGGVEDRPGREFFMARMAAEILGRGDLDVLVYGAGRSMDNVHIGRLPKVRLSAVGDIMKVRDDANFVDITKPAERKYDVVVASEVVEHFRSPRSDFAHLLEYVKDDGLLVCGTTINNGGALEKHRYIFYPDHTAYYSPRSLSLIADAFGWFLDFRPVRQGPKRYVFFTRSPDIARRTTCYFGRRVFAPSEL
jgi:hypothetical protein